MSTEFIIRLIADGAVIPVVVLGIYALIRYVPKEQRLASYGRVLMAGLTAYMLAKIVGYIYQPNALRPFEILGAQAGASYLDNPGFPSDHVLFVTAIACAVWFETRRKVLALMIGIGVIVVAVGRVLALVHAPIDIVGGMVIALIGALWYGARPPMRKEIHGANNR